MGEKRTTCVKGLHDLTDPANVRTKKNGDRQCKPCHDEAKRAWEKKNAKGWVAIQRDNCEVEGCGRPRGQSGANMRSRYCNGHIKRLRKYGELFADVPIEHTPKSLARRRAELQAKTP